ncbi:4Fe-4S binding protein [Chloroflexota bacterium]
MAITINVLGCIGCSMCVTFCPEYALSVTGEIFKCQIDSELCTDCLICVDYCPTNSIEEI